MKFKKITAKDIEEGFAYQERIVDRAIERISKMLEDVPTSPVYSCKTSIDHFYDGSESITVPPSLLEQFNKLGMPHPISREELKEAMDYYNRICGNSDFSTLSAFELGGDHSESV